MACQWMETLFRRAALWFMVLTIVPVIACSETKVVGYYPSWLRHKLPADRIPLETLTHVNHAFVWPRSDGSLQHDFTLNHPELIEQVHAGGRHILLAVGGWGHSDAFPGIAADSTLRRRFIDNLLEFVRTRGYDGIDLDWEYPQSVMDRQNLNRLMAELRQRCNAQTPPLLLTMAISSGAYYGQWHDYETLAEYVDWFNVMTYDYHGSWTPHAGHNAPLFPSPQCPHGSIEASLQYLTGVRRIPASRLLLGIPFYGRQFNASELYGPSTGGDVTYNYSDIAGFLAGGGWQRYWDSTSAVPYLLNDGRTRFITYDDSLSVSYKVQFARERGLGGVMIWALGQDVVGGTSALVQAIAQQLRQPTAIAALQRVPAQFDLAVHPNPARSVATVRYTLSQAGTVVLTVYNVRGQIVEQVTEAKGPGTYRFLWNPGNLPAGVYFIRLGFAAQHRVIKTVVMH